MDQVSPVSDNSNQETFEPTKKMRQSEMTAGIGIEMLEECTEYKEAFLKILEPFQGTCTGKSKN